MGSAPQSIQSLLHIAAPDMADILGRARFLARIRAALLEILPDAAAPHIQVAGYDDFQLRLHVASAAWATRLRYMEKQLTRALAQRMRLQVDGIRIKIRPVNLGPFQPVQRARYLSIDTRRHLEQTAAYIDDRSLADALRRLAAAGRDSE
ncbi:DUF721 domain-containing protein [Salinisphaera hydrothermalis]|uniref:DUF721 domain-containing protein n=2 Tax=Salinisphaera hydrothermalis TaxID=563188 RepID=UPI00333E6BC8